MGNPKKFNHAVMPTMDDIKTMLTKTPIFGAEDPPTPPVVDPPKPADNPTDPPANPLEKTIADLQSTIEANAAELKKYKDAEEAALRKNNTEAENAKKDLDAATTNFNNEKARADSVTARLENEILINKVLETGKFKSEAIEFVIQKLDREKVKVNTDTREVTHLDKALEDIAKNYNFFVSDGNGNNGVTPGGAGNGNNGDNQNGNPWTRAGAPPSPPANKDVEAAKRDSMQHRYSALRSGR